MVKKLDIENLNSVEDLLIKINEIGRNFDNKFKEIPMKQLLFWGNPRISVSQKYHSFSIPKKKKGGKREISAPVLQLRKIQYCIKILLETFYEPPTCVKGFVKGVSIVDNAKVHINKYYVMNLDLEDFFPSINENKVFLCLRRYIKCEKVAGLISHLCCICNEGNEEFLPQGSPTSPILANIVCYDLDNKIMALAKKSNVSYTRYADDMTFSSMYNAYKDNGKFMSRLLEIITRNGFSLNVEKKRIQKLGVRQEVTGVIVSNKVNVHKKYVKELRVTLHNWEKDGYEIAEMAFLKHYHQYHYYGKSKEKTAPTMINVLDGKLEYLKMIKGSEDTTYQKLKKRFDILCSSLSHIKEHVKTWLWQEFEAEKKTTLIMETNSILHQKNLFFREGDKKTIIQCSSDLDLNDKNNIIIKEYNSNNKLSYIAYRKESELLKKLKSLINNKE